jgi:hypothetical protein
MVLDYFVCRRDGCIYLCEMSFIVMFCIFLCKRINLSKFYPKVKIMLLSILQPSLSWLLRTYQRFPFSNYRPHIHEDDDLVVLRMFVILRVSLGKIMHPYFYKLRESATCSPKSKSNKF